MRAAVLILSLSLALSAPAGAQTGLGLRGAQPPVPPAATTGAPVLPAPAPFTAPSEAAVASPPVSPLMSPLPPLPVDGAGQCRLDCAQGYYFCLSGGMADDCPAAWSQCRAACVVAGLRAQS